VYTEICDVSAFVELQQLISIKVFYAEKRSTHSRTLVVLFRALLVRVLRGGVGVEIVIKTYPLLPLFNPILVYVVMRLQPKSGNGVEHGLVFLLDSEDVGHELIVIYQLKPLEVFVY